MNDEDELTLLHRGVHAGNYAFAYYSEDFNVAWIRSSKEHEGDVETAAFRGGFMLGFYGSLELHEIDSDQLEDYLAAHRAWAKKAQESGLAIDDITQEEWERAFG